MMSCMTNLVFGLFLNRDKADLAISEATSLGYKSDEISIIIKEGLIQSIPPKEQNLAEGAASGAATGGIIGGLAGLLIGLGAITIPGIGVLLIGGPISAVLGLTGTTATTVTGAVTGALTGGLVGSLVNLGVPAEEATIIEEKIKEGAIMVATAAKDEAEEGKLFAMFEKNGADQVSSIALKISKS